MSKKIILHPLEERQGIAFDVTHIVNKAMQTCGLRNLANTTNIDDNRIILNAEKNGGSHLSLKIDELIKIAKASSQEITLGYPNATEDNTYVIQDYDLGINFFFAEDELSASAAFYKVKEEIRKGMNSDTVDPGSKILFRKFSWVNTNQGAHAKYWRVTAAKVDSCLYALGIKVIIGKEVESRETEYRLSEGRTLDTIPSLVLKPLDQYILKDFLCMKEAVLAFLGKNSWEEAERCWKSPSLDDLCNVVHIGKYSLHLGDRKKSELTNVSLDRGSWVIYVPMNFNGFTRDEIFKYSGLGTKYPSLLYNKDKGLMKFSFDYPVSILDDIGYIFHMHYIVNCVPSLAASARNDIREYNNIILEEKENKKVENKEIKEETMKVPRNVYVSPVVTRDPLAALETLCKTPEGADKLEHLRSIVISATIETLGLKERSYKVKDLAHTRFTVKDGELVGDVNELTIALGIIVNGCEEESFLDRVKRGSTGFYFLDVSGNVHFIEKYIPEKHDVILLLTKIYEEDPSKE